MPPVNKLSVSNLSIINKSELIFTFLLSNIEFHFVICYFKKNSEFMKLNKLVPPSSFTSIRFFIASIELSNADFIIGILSVNSSFDLACSSKYVDSINVLIGWYLTLFDELLLFIWFCFGA